MFKNLTFLVRSNSLQKEFIFMDKDNRIINLNKKFDNLKNNYYKIFYKL
jgi:hypothetical protein